MGKTGTQRQVCLLALEFAELESNKDKEMAILAKDKEMERISLASPFVL